MTRPILICRRHIDVRSGAGQMIASQARFFLQQGHPVTVSCEKLGKGAHEALAGCNVQRLSRLSRSILPIALRRHIYERRISNFQKKGGGIVIDHGQTIRGAKLNYIHNFLTSEHARRLPEYLSGQDLTFWANCSADRIIVANSGMIKQGLIDDAAVPDANIKVIYPGFEPKRFSPDQMQKMRGHWRRQLGVAEDQRLIGMITSGQFEKRGLPLFLDAVDALRKRVPGLKALVLGGRKEPRLLADHPAKREGQIVYLPTTDQPEQCLSALDVFLYPARYEEFGIVVLEAMAMGIPVVTSSAVGASELVAKINRAGVIAASGDNVSAYCEQVTSALEMSADSRAALAEASADIARQHTSDKHNAAIYGLLREGKNEKSP